MTTTRLTPQAAALMESVRGVGYDVRAAVADLVDNSIAARATTVQVFFLWDGRASRVLIVDDGEGMNAGALERAMTLGSRNPREQRAEHDLGRFGLGLKTASLSQCARRVVASRVAGGPREARVWDLETVTATNDWLVEHDTTPEEADLIDRFGVSMSGTVVMWSVLDRLVGDHESDDLAARQHFQRTAREVEQHLAMVFHRYLEGRTPRLRLYINGTTEEHRIRPWDPFCLAHPATQHLVEARRSQACGLVSLQGFVLPHKDRFTTTDDFDAAGGPGGWNAQQGFYVYRNERLLVAGSWIGLGHPRRWMRDDQHKLARIQLDIPAAHDADWRIDVKKSKAEPPLILRDWLERYAAQVRAQAREVFVHRGNRASPSVQAKFCPTWFADGGASPRYRINREHPTIAALFGSGVPKANVEAALRLLETTIPIHRIWLDVAEKPEVPPPTRQQLAPEQVAKIATELLDRLMAGQSLSRPAALARLRQIEPFDQYPEVVAALENA